MSHRWHCNQGHTWTLTSNWIPVACPRCGSTDISDVEETCHFTPTSERESETRNRKANASLEKTSFPDHAQDDSRQLSEETLAPDDNGSYDQPGSLPRRERAGLHSSVSSDETLEKPGNDADRPMKQGVRSFVSDDADSLLTDETVARPLSATMTGFPHEAQEEEEYEIIDELGRGGMGVVYKARQIQLNRLVALKMILSGSHASPEDMHRFEMEGRAVAQLQHPNIVQIFDVGRREGRPYFALEYVDGGSLQSELDGIPMEVKPSAKITATLARAMHFAHEKGFVHRDLKPANVLMTKDGVPKITDFGLAKQFLDPDSSQTNTGTILGTPSYMSPEQASGRISEIGPATDVYSLGAMFYEMLTGRPPFRGQTVMETVHQVQTTDPVPPRRLQPSVPVDLETICLKCLRKEPYKRYETANDLAEDLDSYLKGEPIKARPVRWWERVYKWTRRRPAVAGLLGALLLVIVGAFFGMMILWLHATAAWRSEYSAKEDAETARKDAERKKQVAEAAEEKANRGLYITKMDLAQRALMDGYRERAVDILDSLIPQKRESDFRGFEWYYLKRKCMSSHLSLKGHTDRITHVTFSPDSRILATASLDRTIKLWDADKEVELFPSALYGHEKPIRSMAFNLDGSILASGGSDGFIFFWNADTGKKIAAFEAHPGAVCGLAFDPGKNRLASASVDGVIKIWDISSLGQAEPSPAESSSSPLFQPVMTLHGHRYAVTCVAFGPNGRWLASGSEDTLVKLWDLQEGKEKQTYKGHTLWLSCIAFSPDGEWLASGGWDRDVWLWSIEGKQRPKRVQTFEQPVRDIAFSPDNSKLAGAAIDGNLQVYDLLNDRAIKNLPGQIGMLRTVAFSRDGQKLGSVNFSMRLIDLTPSFDKHSSLVTSVCFSPDGKTAFSSGSTFDTQSGKLKGEILEWPIADPAKTKNRWMKQASLIRSIDISHDGKFLASGSEDQTVLIQNLDNGEEVTIEGHTERVLSVAFSPKSHLLASASEDGMVNILNAAKSSEFFNLSTEQGAVYQVVFSPDGKLLATAGEDHTVKIWNVAGRRLVKTIHDHQEAVRCLTFSPDGKYLASSGEDLRILIHDLTNLQDIKGYNDLRGHNDTITCLTYTPDGKRLISGSLDHTIKIWDPVTRQELFTLRGHTGGITSLAFHPNEQLLLSASRDHTVRIWDGRAAQSAD